MATAKLRLVLAIASSGRHVPFAWAMSIPTIKLPMNIGYAQAAQLGPDRGKNREDLAEYARQAGAEYVFFLDDDTVIPPDTLHKLMQELDADPTVDVCGGIYTSKSNPPQPLVFKEKDEGVWWQWKVGDVFPAYVVGTGCMMIRTSVFDRIPKPWFKDIDWSEASGEPKPDDELVPDNVDVYHLTDDVYFCEKLRRVGGKLLAHGGVLPVHFGADATPYVLDPNSPPMRGTDPNTLWYRNILKQWARK